MGDRRERGSRAKDISTVHRAPLEKPAADEALQAEMTEDGVARLFTEQHRDRLRFDHDLGSWFRWTGHRWERERTGLALSLARDLAHKAGESATPRERAAARRSSFVGGVERLARTDRAHAVTQDQWDRDPLLLGCPGATINLRTGNARRPNPADGITRLTGAAPADTAECPRWMAFLDETTGGDADVVRFLRQIAGYAATGETREHALFFLYGPGGNGKSVFLNTVCGVLGEYAATASMDTFTASAHDKPTADLAMLRGARLVTASETEEGRAWAESRIKQVTGGDPITARFMRMNFFTYRPEFKLLIAGNHKPVLRNVDEAARRRFNVLPFTRRPAVPDRTLEEKLRSEWPGILRWVIDGALDWQVNGLVRPAAVVAETDAYFEAQDGFAQWLEEACVTDLDNPHRWETSADLYSSWRQFAEAGGESAGTQKSFGDRMKTRGYRSDREYVGGRRLRCWKSVSFVKREATYD